MMNDLTNPGKMVDGFNPQFMLFQSTFVASESDLSVPVAGGMNLSFKRVFGNQYGWARGDNSKYFTPWGTDDTVLMDTPYRDNIGESWSHNLNLYLRVTQDYGHVLFHDEVGNTVAYTRACETPSTENCAPMPGCITSTAFTFPQSDTEDYYTRYTPADMEIHNNSYKGTAWEEGIVITRQKQGCATTGWKMRMPDGKEYGFSQETAWPEQYARLTYIKNTSGTQVTLSYDTTGRLSRVDAPSGDGRYLQFAYSGASNRIASVSLMAGTTSVKVVQYYYNASDFLIRVDKDNDGNTLNDTIYGYYSDPAHPGSFMLSSMSGGDAVFAAISYVWADFGEWGWQPKTVTVTKAGIQKTTFDRSLSDSQVTVINYNTSNIAVSKTLYKPDWYATTLAWARFYPDPAGTIYQQWSYVYDNNHFLQRVNRPTSGGGNYPIADYIYNAQGKVTKVTRLENLDSLWGLEQSWQYDSSGLWPTAFTDSNGLVTQYVYDANKRVIQVKPPSQGPDGTQYSYTTAGQIATVTDPLGKVTTYGYDARGNRTSITNPLSQTTTMAYDDQGRVVQVTDPLGKSATYTYINQGCGCGGTGQIATITDALNNVTTFEYNSRGQNTKVTDPAGMATDYQYDNLGRLTGINAPSGSSNWTTFAYDTLGRMTSTTDMGGHTTKMTYDHMGRLLTRTEAYGTAAAATVSRTYDTMGNATAVTDERGKVTTYTYAEEAFLTQVVDPVGKCLRYFYDAKYRVNKVGAGSAGTTDPTEYTYSATTGLLTKTRYWSGTSYYDADFTYDNAGRTTKVADWINSTFGIQYAFDDAGRLSTKKDYAATETLSYTYDAAGHIASMTDPNGQVTTYTYTDTGRLDTITAPGGKVWNYDYNSLGQKTQYTHPNGTRTEYGYDTRHRLTSITHKDASNNAVLDAFTFTLDTEGNISQVVHVDGTKFVYTYDQRHRVTNGTLKDSGNSTLRTYGYTYDVANNLTAKTRTVTTPASSNSWVYGYDDANEQTSATMNGGTPETRTYDAWGRMATRTQGTSSATYGYRYGGKQYSYATNFGGEAAETLQYRGDGRLYSRVSGTTTKVYRYDRGWNAINEEDGAGNLAATSVYAPGAAVGERLAYSLGALSGPVTAYAYHDQLGSTRAWRWGTKALAGRNDFAPYGEPYTSYTTLPVDYALHVQDPYTLNYHAPYREYASGWGRWTTRDPLGMVNGPNEYAYVGDGPIRNTDPMGLMFLPPPPSTGQGRSAGACLKALAELALASEKVFERVGDIFEEGADPLDDGHVKALRQAKDRLDNAVDDVNKKCGKYMDACSAIAGTIAAALAAAAAAARLAAPFLFALA